MKTWWWRFAWWGGQWEVQRWAWLALIVICLVFAALGAE